MNKPINLQDAMLNALRKSRQDTVIFLVSGFQIRGKIRGYDSFVVIMETADGKQQMIYKHAISTVVPTQPVELRDEDTEA